MIIPSHLDLSESSRVTTYKVLFVLIDYSMLLWPCTNYSISEHSEFWALQNPNICYLLLFLYLQNVLVQNNASSLLSKLTNNKYIWLQGWTNFPENGKRYFLFVILIFHWVIFLLKAKLLLGSKSRAIKNLI